MNIDYKSLVSLDIVFDNAEGMTVPAEFITFLSVGKISEGYISMNPSNIIKHVFTCEAVRISFSKEANNMSNYSVCHEKILPFDRLQKYNDIIALCLNFIGGNNKEFMVKSIRCNRHKDGSLSLTI